VNPAVTSLSAAERDLFVSSARSALAGVWPAATAAGAEGVDGLIGRVWDVAAECGWFELGEAGDLQTALALTAELGRVACPLPVLDGFAAVWLAGPQSSIAAEIAAGAARVLIAAADGRDEVWYADAATAATHVLLLPERGGVASLRAIAAVRPRAGLAAPAWHDVSLGGDQARLDVGAEQAAEAIVLLRLGLTARAAAAAQRTHEFAVEHARTRIQFGKVIGSFGAVQQRTASNQIDVSANALLLGEAARSFAAGAPHWPLAARLAVAHVRLTAAAVQLGAQHTLAASGYFDEHEGPWLFRRVHADLARLATLPDPAGEVADSLVEGGLALPPVSADEQGERFRAELAALLGSHATGDPARPFGDGGALRQDMAERGYFGMGWPAAHGGRDASVAEQVVLNEEVQYHQAPVRDALNTVMLLGNSILRHGTPEQQAEFLPRMRRGEIRFCLGYSEPETGSDLASLRTRAVQLPGAEAVGGACWVINGQKSWTTNAHVATHVWLACRTDPDAVPRHAGITVFLIPMDTPGITVQRHTALSGEISCTVFYDDVRVPDTARVGQVNGGWRVIIDALAGERVVMGGVAAVLRRQFDDLLAGVRTDPARYAGAPGSSGRAVLGRLAARLQATRVLVAAAINATSSGRGAALEAPIAGVLGGELAEEFGEAVLELLGPEAALAEPHPGSPFPPTLEYQLRLAPMFVIGGGTNDIQRGMIARALGLPR
jgi:alkylation response protein AidB-like acyl-CoA dehydrogenase